MIYRLQAFTRIGYMLAASAILYSCTTSGPSGIFGKKTPHEQYGQRLTDAGLKTTALGQQWFQAAQQSLSKPLTVNLPYSETGYFAAERPTAAGILFSARRGQKLTIGLSKNPETGFAIYLDLWKPAAAESTPKLLAAADTSNLPLEFEVKDNGNYQLRLQPELLKSGAYTLTISTGPSLAFPLPAKAKTNIGSFWGAGRDAGARSHEGIDIFAPKRTPLLAAAKGTVTAVNENRLGGKVVWLRPAGKEYTLYYAHLDEQIAQPGQAVEVGDTIGLVGNTGNAITTAPHLHFGIYTSNGAIDPLPFVNPVIQNPGKITAATAIVNQYARSNKTAKVYPEPNSGTREAINITAGDLMFVEAATAGWYKVLLPGGGQGFVSAGAITPARNSARLYTLKTATVLADAPVEDAPKIILLSTGKTVSVLGNYGAYYYVREIKSGAGWIPKNALSN